MTTDIRTDPPAAEPVDPPVATPAAAPAERRVRLRSVTREETLTLAGAAFGALALDWVLYERVLALSGVFGFWVGWYVIFMLMYAAMAALQWDLRAVQDRVASVAFATGGLFTVAVVLDLILYMVARGLHAFT